MNNFFVRARVKLKAAADKAKQFLTTVTLSALHVNFRYLNDEEIVDNEHFKISCKEDEYLYRVDIEDCNENHYGKVKIVAKNENGESVKEVML